MNTADMEEIRLVLGASEPCSSAVLCQCRICHEEEDAEKTEMESPCGCSGSLKFAHRGCIQRWCDEKGSTLCEICLKNFEPGYTLPPKIHLVDVVVTIRGSLEVPRLNYEPHSASSDDDLSDFDDLECSPSVERGAPFYRSVGLMVTVMLLVRHLFAMLTVGTDQQASALSAVFFLRAIGILLPFYLVMRMVAAIQRAQWQQHRRLGRYMSARERNGAASEVEEDLEMQSHRVQIHP